MEVVVPDDQLSLAIGKRGENVRLASKLTGWKLDVTGESDYNQVFKDGYKSLMSLEEIDAGMASELYERGMRSAEDVAGADMEDLMSSEDMTEEKCIRLIEAAKKSIENAADTSGVPEKESDAPGSVEDEEEVVGGA
jgi:N utilization substance protein A